ncbi:hypothetical protein [Vagococcus salmoninarum]|uniref:hypothetical protein n=1 Tax=Vagococcus salmoninarum TaxID=2739 RepID=UPI003F993BFB
MSGIVWNLLSTVIGGAIGGGGSKAIKNLPTSMTTNAVTGAIGGLIASFLGSGKLDLASLLTTIVGGAGAPAILNIIMKSLVKPAK